MVGDWIALPSVVILHLHDSSKRSTILTRFPIELNQSENFGDIFEVVKKSVKVSLHKERAGLMLVLADLPIALGAYHGVGSNSIVMNRALLDRIVAAGHPQSHVNAFVYSILLHEYLHSLGVLDESKVRQLVYEVSNETFGPDHPATNIAAKGPWSLLRRAGSVEAPYSLDADPEDTGRNPELVADFDRSHRTYIG